MACLEKTYLALPHESPETNNLRLYFADPEVSPRPVILASPFGASLFHEGGEPWRNEACYASSSRQQAVHINLGLSGLRSESAAPALWPS